MRKRITIRRAVAALVATVTVIAGARAAETPILRIEAGGHIGGIKQVLFTADGRQVISVGLDKAVRIWDTQTGRQVRAFRQVGAGRVGEINAAALSGSLLATAGSDVVEAEKAVGPSRVKTEKFVIRIFDVANGRTLRVFPAHDEPIVALAYAPDGSILASTSFDKAVRLWDPDTGQLLKTLKGNKGFVLGVAFSPDGRQIAGADYEGTVNIWELETGNLRTLPGGARVRCVAWSSGGAIAAGLQDRAIRLWTGGAADTSPRRLEQADSVTSLAFSPDGKLLLSGSGENERQNDRTVRLWSVPEGKLLHQYKEHTGTISAVGFSPEGRVAASADMNGVVHLWDPDTARPQQRLASTGDSIFGVAWSPDGRRVAWGKTPDGAPRAAFDLYNNRPGAVKPGETWVGARADRNGQTLSITPDRKAVVIRSAGGQEVKRIRDDGENPDEVIYAAGWTPQGQVVVGTAYGLARYDVGGRIRQVAQYVGHAGVVLAVAVSPDGRYLASGSADQTIRIWSLGEKGRDIGITRNAVEPLMSLFSGRDGEWVAWNDRYGYYAASPAGDDIIGWQVNRGPNRAAEFHRAFQFRKQFYRPDVVCRLLEAGSVGAALQKAPAGPAAPPPDPTITLAEQVAKLPAVEIVDVAAARREADGYLTSEPKVRVRVRVTDAAPAAVSLQIHVNRPASEKRLRELPETERPDERLLEAPLRAGQNIISIVAKNPAGESLPATVKVTYNPPPGEQADPGERSLYVLSIGVSEYEDPAITPLLFANNDAEKVAAFYQKQQDRLAKKVTVTKLKDHEAKKARIEEALASLEKQVRENDMVIVFLSGHGFYIGDNFYFAPHDVVHKDLPNTGLDTKKVLQRLTDLKCSDVVLMLDHCYSGGININLADVERSRGRDVRNEQGRQLRETNLFTLTASMPNQESYEHAQWQGGAFTFALLEALEGEGQTREAYVNLTGARDYLLERVPDLLKSAGLPLQVPKLFYPPTIDDLVPRNLHIARVR